MQFLPPAVGDATGDTTCDLLPFPTRWSLQFLDWGWTGLCLRVHSTTCIDVTGNLGYMHLPLPGWGLLQGHGIPGMVPAILP